MGFRDYFLGLDQAGREDYAAKVGLSHKYILCHLISHPPRKYPPMNRIIDMAAATNGAVTEAEMIEHFRFRPAIKDEPAAATS